MTENRLLTVTQAALQATAVTALILFFLHGLSVLTPLPPVLHHTRLIVAAACGLAVLVLLACVALVVWQGRSTETDDTGRVSATQHA